MTLSHILGTHSVFSQLLPVSYFDIFSVENNQSVIFTTTTTTNFHAPQVHVPNSAINRIFNINFGLVLLVLDNRTNNGYVENNKRSFKLLILPNGL
ncbi:hypothetical protein N9483_02060 [Flavobacteriaceae bacterium]|nr:hypothetical protein [Flavobacteriaceae bacterium]